MAPILIIVINSCVSFVFLFIISKLLGKKQIAQLEFVDYVVGILLGSIAASFAIDAEQPFYYYLIAMTIFFVFAYLVGVLGRKNSFLKRILKGKPTTLIYEGKIIYKNLKKANIDINDLLAMLREKNFFDVSNVAYAIFETSGKLSVLPKGNQTPVVIEDIKPSYSEKAMLTNTLIVDGKISYSGLNDIKKNKDWLFKQLKIKDKKQLKNIILAVYDNKFSKINVHYKNVSRK